MIIGLGLGVGFPNGVGAPLPGVGSSLRLMLKGTGPFDLGDGDDILRWHDLSGFANNIEQPVTGNQPTPEGSSVRFVQANTDHLIQNAGGIAAIANGDDSPFTVAMRVQRVAGTGCLFGFGNSASANAQMQIQHPTTTGTSKYRFFRRDDSGGAGAGQTADVNSTENIDANVNKLVWIFTGTTLTLRINGVVSSINATACNVGNMTLNRFTLGAGRLNAGAINPIDHRVFSFLMYNVGNLSADDLANIEANL